MRREHGYSRLLSALVGSPQERLGSGLEMKRGGQCVPQMVYRFSFCLALAFLVKPNLDAVRTQAQLSEPAPDSWPPQAAAPVVSPALAASSSSWCGRCSGCPCDHAPHLGACGHHQVLTDCSLLLFLASSPTDCHEAMDELLWRQWAPCC